MKRYALLAAVMLALASGTSAVAQLPPPPEPAPSSDPHVYTDPAMTYTAPPDAVLVGSVPKFNMGELTADLQTIAQWVIRPGQEDSRTIQILMEAYNGPPDQWEGQFESQTHNTQDSALIRNKAPMTLLNGMPAYYVEVATGSGFDAQKEYAVVWADGQRGIVLALTTRMGDTSPDLAKEVLKQVTAVQYPVNEP